MITKTIKISAETHDALLKLASKNETFNDVIDNLISYYNENEEFTDKEAEIYNKEIEKFEKDQLDNVTEVTLTELENRISKLEKQIREL